MKKNHNRRKIELLLFLTLLLFLLVPCTQAHTITVPTNAYFGLPTYGTYINFNTQQTFGNIYRESSYWYFGSYGFQVQNANMTITDLFVSNNLKLSFTVSAPSEATSTTKVYVGSKGKPVDVTGATSWSYNSGTKILTVAVTHKSSQQVEVSWWSRPVRSIWLNFLPVVFVLGIVLVFAGKVKRTGRVELDDIIIFGVAFILAAILLPIAINILYGA